ncbi:MAG: hypothetical protein QXZ31_07055 [Thermofilaceae archaeon]
MEEYPEEIIYEGKRLKREMTDLGPVYVDEEGVVYPIQVLPEEVFRRPAAAEPAPVVEGIEIEAPERVAEVKEAPPPPPAPPPEPQPAPTVPATPPPPAPAPERPPPRERVPRRPQVGRAARQLQRELKGMIAGYRVTIPGALKGWAWLLAWTTVSVGVGYVDKLLYGYFSSWGVVADAASIIAAPLHFIALSCVTLVAASLLLTLSRAWMARGGRSVLDAVLWTVVAVAFTWPLRKVWLVVIFTQAAGMLVTLLMAALPAVATLAGTLLLALLGAGVLALLVLSLLAIIFLPFIVYALLILPLLFMALFCLHQAGRAAARFIDLGLPLLLGLFAVARMLAPGLAEYAAAAAVLLSAALAAGTQDYRWLRVAAAAIVVNFLPPAGLETLLEPAYRVYVETIGTPGAYYGYRLLVRILEWTP